ncbi:MAG: vitamin K epoxide reductase [Anaerolineae bacterium]|nr:vitamin K epoxide reductase [Anaerolineae bacterium]
MKKLLVLFICALFFVFAAGPVSAVASNAQPVVEAVLFFSPACPHCHKVMEEDLPPLYEKYGPHLKIETIDTTTENGQKLYQAAVSAFNIPQDRQGVPTLIIGQNVLVGSSQIPNELPGLIEEGLKNGGTPLPSIPGLETVVTPTPAAAVVITPPVQPSSGIGFIDNFQRDPAGNSLAVVVLIFMLIVVVYEISRRPWRVDEKRTSWFKAEWQRFAIPLFVLAGLLVSGYLSVVEVVSLQAYCGPVGHCNAVQQSEYAKVFGILPVGVLGVLGNLSILTVWWVKEYTSGRLAELARPALLLLTGFGICFSIYLTFLEPFVIGATCLWCISSALIMTGMFYITCETAAQPVAPDEEEDID